MTSLRRATGPIVLVAAVLAVALLVDPLREAVTQDDAWFYAWTARRFLESGAFQLHSYATASMPAQVLWAGMLASALGDSLATLRVSTLLASTLGLLAFHGLLLDQGLSRRRALAFALLLFASPYGFVFSYSFTTDVPFASWLLVATFLLGRALRDDDLRAALAASVAGAAAIGTRQFGVMLIAGALVVWAFDPRRRSNARHYVAGLVLPCAMAAWQATAYLAHPTWMQSVMQAWQAETWRLGPLRLVGEALWRSVVLLQYACLLVLPIAPLLVGTLHAVWSRVQETPRARLVRLAAVGALVLVALLFCRATAETALGEVVRQVRFPSIPWFLPFWMPQRTVPAGLAWAAITALAVVWLGWIAARQGASRVARSALSPAQRLPFAIGACLLLGHATFPTLIDTYAVPLAPLVLLAFARELRDLRWPKPWLIAAVVAWVAVTGYSTLWLRGKLEHYEALFTVGARLQAAGIPASDISGGYHWDGYHGAFDAWLDASGARSRPAEFAGPHRVDKAYHGFVDERRRTAAYRIDVLEGGVVPHGWTLVARQDFRDARLRLRTMAGLKRAGP